MKKWKIRLAGLLACILVGTATVTPAAAAGPFRDVPAGHWAADYIAQAVQLGLVQGETADDFGAGHPMTRAAFTVALCRMFGWETERSEESAFVDVRDPSLWYYDAVETALANGALTPQISRFRPDDAVTREEMVVMLVRALGYTTLSGLDLGLECPFRDVTSNENYITLAYYLDISSGTAADKFSPDAPATREQAVAMLMRVRERMLKTAPERIGIVPDVETPVDLAGCDAAAVAGIRLTAVGGVTEIDPELSRAARENARAAGAKALLRIAGGPSVLKAEPEIAAASIAAAAGEYDGVLLDITGVTEEQKKPYTKLARQARAALGDKLLYLTADAPSTDGAGAGYDCAALSGIADRLILRVASYAQETNDFPVLPREPLEEVYFALASLKGTVDLSRCSLWLTTTGASRTEGNASTDSLDARQIQELLADPGTADYYSARYAGAYLIASVEKKQTVVWFHDRRSAAVRVRLCAFFGVESVCLGNLESLADDPAASLLPGLG